MGKIFPAFILAFAFAPCGAAAQSTELSVDGAPVRFEARRITDFSFPGRLGEGVSVFVTGLAHTPQIESNSVMRIHAPDSSIPGGLGCRAEGEGGGLCKVHIAKLPASGRYTVRFSPPRNSAATGEISVVADQQCQLASRGTNVLKGALPGQVIHCTFAARAGERLNFDLAPVRWPAGSEKMEVSFKVSQPNGQVVFGHSIYQGGRDVEMPPRAFPATGTYTLDIDAGFGTVPPLTFSLTGR